MRDIITKLEELNVEQEQLNEGLADMAHEAEKDHEVQMARSDCYKSAKYAVSIHKMLKDVSEMEGIDGWVASKLTKAADYLGSVKHYMEGQAMQDVELAVVPVAGDMTDAMTMDDIEVTEGRMSMRQLASMDKDAARKIEAMVGDESKYADMGDYQEALYNAAKKLGLVESKIDEGYEKMVANALKDAGIPHDGFKDGFLRIDQDDMKAARKAIKDADMDPPKMIAEDEEAVISEDREVMVKATNIEYDGPALDKLPTDKNVKVMVPAGADDEDVYEMVAEKIEDQHGVKVSGFDMAFMEQDAIEEEDVIGDIIASLSKTKERMPMPKSKPAVPMQSKQKMANKMALPKSKPDMSMAQDTTRPLTMSKFSEWSKK